VASESEVRQYQALSKRFSSGFRYIYIYIYYNNTVNQELVMVTLHGMSLVLDGAAAAAAAAATMSINVNHLCNSWKTSGRTTRRSCRTLAKEPGSCKGG